MPLSDMKVFAAESARPASRLHTPGAISCARELLSRVYIADCSHSRLGASTSPMTIESLKKRLTVKPSGGEQVVDLVFEWEFSRR